MSAINLMDPAAAADATFEQANRSGNAQFLTAGEVLCQLLEVGCPDATSVFPGLLLCLDTTGDNQVTKAELRAGYSRFCRGALRPKVPPPVSVKSADEMDAFEKQAIALLQPKIAVSTLTRMHADAQHT